MLSDRVDGIAGLAGVFRAALELRSVGIWFALATPMG